MSNPTITVYSKPACVQCSQTKKALDRKGAEYVVIDITEDAVAYDKVVSMGFASAPVVMTETEAWSGFQPERINALFA